ncbi:MAG: phosphate signaling complex protein PhoU [Planctomycetota bacterium]
MHRQFDDKLHELLQKLALMGRLSEAMIAAALRMLIERNLEYTQEIFQKEDEVNELQIEVDDRAVKLTALQQPVAGDVRFLFMASRIATELERVADQAVNIAQNAQHLLEEPPLKPLIDLPVMAQIAQKMVRGGLDALVKKDCDLAQIVLEEEKKVDAFRDQIFRELLTYMMADPGTIKRAISLILISRNLERVGDHATNIAEEVIYMVKGRDVRHRHELKT